MMDDGRVSDRWVLINLKRGVGNLPKQSKTNLMTELCTNHCEY